MKANHKRKILIVDDDSVSLKILDVILSREQLYEIHRAVDGEEGIRIARETRPDVIISDYYMPGIDGLEFCRNIKNDPELNKTIFVLLTVETDIVTKITGLEEGADDYIEKTVSSNVLLSKVKAFLRIKSLRDELVEEREKLKAANQLLEVNFKELVAVLLKILEIQIPGTSDRARIAKEAAYYITAKMGVDPEKTKRVVFGALMHELGKTGLPQGVIKKNYKDLCTEEKEVFNQHPVIGSIIISTISGFKQAADDVYHQYENYDGSGFPDRLLGNEICIGARILRGINFHEELVEMGCTSQEVVDRTRLAMGKHLDPSVAAHLVNFLIDNDDKLSRDKEKITVDDMRVGMVIAEDVYSANGTKILPKNVQIKDWMLNIILERNLVDPIIGGIYIVKK